jgi:rRNA maturation endonuclease Nob1
MDRVAERHEALAITVQQIEETQQRQQKMAEALLVAMREEHVANREANRQLRESMREQGDRIDALVNATELLFQTASRHESRIDKLERG